jgi:tetrapyrrole methylase family protein/MazG family protein
LKIIIIGLGPGDKEYLSQKTLNILNLSNVKIFFRTEKHPAVKGLIQDGIKFETFDYLYDSLQTFDEVYETITDILIKEACSTGDTIIYGVPGNPLVAEKTVKILLEKSKEKKIPVEVIAATSGLEAIYSSLKIDPCQGLIILDALDFDSSVLNVNLPIIFTQVYNQMVASDLKLTLMDYFNEEHRVTVIRHAGMADEIKKTVPLFEIDRIKWIDHLTSLYVPIRSSQNDYGNKIKYPLDPLVEIMDKLRGPDGCPWDRKQTFITLKKYVIEETYEVLEAIDQADMNKLAEELGDLLLQVVFLSKLAKEKDYFDINDVISVICKKLIRRHPHVFSDAVVNTPQEVELNWEKIKSREKNSNNGSRKLLDSVPKVFPALLKAQKLQDKAAKVGFDWADIAGPIGKVREELKELDDAIKQNKREKVEEEIGDLFFAIVNVCRFLDIDAETSLQRANLKFTKRFSYIEERLLEKNLQWNELNLQYMDMLWEEAKKSE